MSGIECERLGVLWRSQGEAFLQEQAVTLQADMDRLRAAYVANVDATATVHEHRWFGRPPKVIDLRETDVTGTACSTAGHGDVVASTRCTRWPTTPSTSTCAARRTGRRLAWRSS